MLHIDRALFAALMCFSIQPTLPKEPRFKLKNLFSSILVIGEVIKHNTIQSKK